MEICPVDMPAQKYTGLNAYILIGSTERILRHKSRLRFTNSSGMLSDLFFDWFIADHPTIPFWGCSGFDF